jgi:predicted dinucleotide-binding enzyme
MAREAVAILGAGRMGQGLALALQQSGREVFLLSRTVHPVVAPL